MGRLEGLWKRPNVKQIRLRSIRQAQELPRQGLPEIEGTIWKAEAPRMSGRPSLLQDVPVPARDMSPNSMHLPSLVQCGIVRSKKSASVTKSRSLKSWLHDYYVVLSIYGQRVLWGYPKDTFRYRRLITDPSTRAH